MLHSVALVTRALILKGHSRVPKNLMSGKTLVFLTLTMGIMVFACFRGTFLSKLAVKQRFLPIYGMDEVIPAHFMVGTLGGGSSESNFAEAPNTSVMLDVWNAVMEPNYDKVMTKSVNEGFEVSVSHVHFLERLREFQPLAENCHRVELRVLGLPIGGTDLTSLPLRHT